MANFVLYRKYRPQTFAEVVGQEHIVQTLTNALATSTVSHGYLFCGPHGTGKTTLARLLAKAVNCQQRREGLFEPCNQCSSCLEITEGRAIDLVEIDAASNRGIDEIRNLREGIKFVPTKSKYKVFILDEAHQLSKDGAQALLKTLEEPPPHAIFILATTEVHKMIPTIISRCQRFDFRKLTLVEIIKRLERLCSLEGVRIEKAALEVIALNSNGAIRDAESLLDQTLAFVGTCANQQPIKAADVKDLLGIVDFDLISKIMEPVFCKQSGRALNFLEEILEKGCNLQQFARAIIKYLRQALILKINPDLNNPIVSGLTKEEQIKLQEQISPLSQAHLQGLLKLFLEAESRIKYSPFPEISLELAVIEACQVAGREEKR